MEITGIALQTVSAGEDVAFTETAVNGTKCIVHRTGSGIIKLRGITNQCKARFLVSYSGNIQIPTGGTVEAISLAIAVDGEPLQSTKMIVTPAAVLNMFNVSAQAYVDVPCKNGKLIWENDIVKINNSKMNALITFRDFEIICTIPSEKYYKHRLEYDTEYEVVGNIFDNKELLESEG